MASRPEQTTGAGLLADFDAQERRRALADGDVLAHQDDEADEVYVVVEGEIRVTVREKQPDGKRRASNGDGPAASTVGDLTLATLGPGDVAGEITVVAGGRRTATLSASGPAIVLVIDRSSFEDWLMRHPEEMNDLIARARDRLDRTLIAQILAELVGEAESDVAISRVVDRLDIVRLQAGNELFRQGDQSDAAYIVVSGRLRVDVELPEPRSLGEVGRGEVVGEIGLLDDAPRSASIRAVRDSTLARLTIDEFRSLVQEKPQMILHFARTVLRRTAGRRERRDRAATVAVVLATGDAGSFVDDLSAEIGRHGAMLRLSASRIDEILERPGIAQAAAAASGLPRLSEYLHEMEGRHDHLVYEIGELDEYWSRLAVRQADRVVVVVSPRPSSDEHARIEGVKQRLAELPDVPVWFVVVHPPLTRRPGPTADLRRRHRPAELVHVRRDDAEQAARAARLVIDRGTGLVLSGGGARGFAHIGVIKAMTDREMPIDRVGGASVGSILAAGVAVGLGHDEIAKACKEMFRGLMDYTVPLVSVVRGRRISDGLERFFEGWSIGDMWVPYYCVSSDLTAGDLHVHDSGDLAEAIRASISIPGMLPPVAKDGHLLVDGGVLDNLPVDTMKAQRGVSRIIAVDVAPIEGPEAPEDYGPHVSATEVVRARFRKGPSPYPALPAVLVRSMLVGAVRDRNRVMESGAIDLYIDIDVPEIGLLDFDQVEPAVERGYRASARALDDWLADGRA